MIREGQGLPERRCVGEDRQGDRNKDSVTRQRQGHQGLSDRQGVGEDRDEDRMSRQVQGSRAYQRDMVQEKTCRGVGIKTGRPDIGYISNSEFSAIQ